METTTDRLASISSECAAREGIEPESFERLLRLARASSLKPRRDGFADAVGELIDKIALSGPHP